MRKSYRLTDFTDVPTVRCTAIALIAAVRVTEPYISEGLRDAPFSATWSWYIYLSAGDVVWC